MRTPAVVLLILLFTPSFVAARADTFSFSVSSSLSPVPGVDSTAYGTLTANLDPGYPGMGVYDVTAGSAELNGEAMTLVPVSTPGQAETSTFNGSTFIYSNTFQNPNEFDMVFSWGSEYIDFDGSYSRNFVYSTGENPFGRPRVFWQIADAGAIQDPIAQDPIAVTPEPSSIALLGTGVLGIGTLMRRRKGDTKGREDYAQS